MRKRRRRTDSPCTAPMRLRRRYWTMAAVSWQVGTSSVWFYLTKVAEPGSLSLERQGSLLLSRLRRYITPLINELALLMMGRRIAPAADDTARLRRKFKKRRFQMIVDTIK